MEIFARWYLGAWRRLEESSNYIEVYELADIPGPPFNLRSTIRFKNSLGHIKQGIVHEAYIYRRTMPWGAIIEERTYVVKPTDGSHLTMIYAKDVVE